MPTDRTVDVHLRPGGAEDAGAVAALFTATRRAAVPAMPPPVHSAEEDLAWLTDRLSGGGTAEPAVGGSQGPEVWLAERACGIVGLLLLEDDWLHSLYVDPGHQARGIGSMLVELAQALRPDGLRVWVFETNTGARRLYERHGFEVVAHTDGSEHDERAPDVRLAWSDPPGEGGPLRR